MVPENQNKNGIYNLGTGKARSWNDLTNAVFAALDKTPNIEYIEIPDILRNKYQYFTEAEMNKLSSIGCNVEFQSLEESVKDYVCNYLAKDSYFL